MFSQPASHPSSGLGSDAHRVDLEHTSQTGQDTTAGEAGAHSSDAPEVLAEEILKRPSCTRAEVERLSDMLPKEVPSKKEEGEAEGSSFSTGCWPKAQHDGVPFVYQAARPFRLPGLSVHALHYPVLV